MASKPIAHMPLRKSYAGQVLVIGEAAGQVKATRCGIYYGLLAARLAAETISRAFASRGCRFISYTVASALAPWMGSYATSPAMGSKT